LHPEMFGFVKKFQKRLPSKSTDIYALGMTIFEVVTRRRPFDHLKTDAVYMHVIEGGRPERPTVVFSDVLWGLLQQSWYCEYESMLPRRPPISLLRAQLEQDSGTWVSAIGMSRSATIVADDTTPSSPTSDADPGLQVLLKQVQELLGFERPTTASTPTVAPTPAAASIPIPSPDQPPPRGPQKGKGVKTVRRGSFRRFRDKFRSLLAKFSLSDGLVPEREENPEIVERSYGKLFS